MHMDRVHGLHVSTTDMCSHRGDYHQLQLSRCAQQTTSVSAPSTRVLSPALAASPPMARAALASPGHVRLTPASQQTPGSPCCTRGHVQLQAAQHHGAALTMNWHRLFLPHDDMYVRIASTILRCHCASHVTAYCTNPLSQSPDQARFCLHREHRTAHTCLWKLLQDLAHTVPDPCCHHQDGWVRVGGKVINWGLLAGTRPP